MKRILSISLFLFLGVSGTAHAIDFSRISDYELCASATGRVNLETRKWDPRAKYQPYIAEAKRRGISCRVGSKQGLDGLSRATRAEKPVLRPETSNAPENCKLSKLTIIEIQTAAQALGLYKSSIDGLAGNGTTGAIKAAKKLFTKTASKGDCVTAGDLAELKALAEVNKALALSKTCNADQIDKCSDVQTCEKATLLQDSLRRWNLSNMAFVNRAKNLSLDCKITVDNIPYNQEESKYYLSLLTDFVGENPSVFELGFSTRYDGVRPILSDQWSPELSINFESFRVYLSKFIEFQQFMDAKTNEVLEVEKARVDQLRGVLVQNQSQLEAWAKQNVLDKKAAQVAGLIAIIADKNNQSVNGLELLVSESQALLSAIGIKDVPATQETNAEVCDSATIVQNGTRSWKTSNMELVNRAKALGLDCKITADGKPFTLEEAKYYLSLLTDFVGQSPAAFDLKFATEFGSVRPILSDQWSSDLSKSFEEFRLYLVNFPEFEQYLDAKKAAVDAEEKVRIDQLRAALVQNQSLLEAWAKQNVLDKKAEQVAGLIAAISDKNNQSVNGLELLVAESQALLSATGIKDVPATQETKAKINGLFEPTSVYVFLNRSGDAGSVYKSLEGKTAFEQGRGSYCASDKLDPMDFYILQGKIFGLWSDLKGLDAKSCGRDTDVFIVQGNEITSDRLYNAIALSDLEQAVEFTMQQRDEEYGRLTFLKDTIEQDVINGTRIGFGALTVESSEGPMCAVLNDKQQAHGEILTSNQTLLKVYGINDAKFSDVFSGENEAFKSLQRQQCGMIYGSALSLGRLYLAGKSAGIKLEFLPLWVSPREVDEKNTALEAEKAKGAQQLNTSVQSIEDQQRLEQEAQRTLAEKATIRQRELREQNGLRFTIIKDQLQAEIFAAIDFAYNNSPDDAGYVAKYVEQTFVDKDTRYSPYDGIIANVQQMAAEKWEITEKTVSQIDYGSTKFNDREVEGLVVELKMASKNRLIGKYSEYCKRVHVMNDADFEIWREFEMSECIDNGSTASWKSNWAFDSKWIVEGAQ
jgi:Tfp pilus assembly protein PilE